MMGSLWVSALPFEVPSIALDFSGISGGQWATRKRNLRILVMKNRVGYHHSDLLIGALLFQNILQYVNSQSSILPF
jgi:hypothetical protein